MLEKDVIKKANTFAKLNRVVAIRMHFGQGVYTAWPDYLYLIPGGRPLFVEYKATGKKPTPKQRLQIKILEDLGYDVIVADTPEIAIEAISRSLAAARLSGEGR